MKFDIVHRSICGVIGAFFGLLLLLYILIRLEIQNPWFGIIEASFGISLGALS